jgi:UDPglucose 6-dehydrogenase
VSFAASALEACEGADALAIVTEWKQFRSPDFTTLKAKLKHGVIFDGRNLYDPRLVVSNGLDYVAIGRNASADSGPLRA